MDDPVFFVPVAPYFDARIARPSIPLETGSVEMVLQAVEVLGGFEVGPHYLRQIRAFVSAASPFGDVRRCRARTQA